MKVAKAYIDAISNLLANKKLWLWLSVVVVVCFLLWTPRIWFRQKKKEYNRALQEFQSIERKRNKSNAEIYYLAQKYSQGIPEVIHGNSILPGLAPDIKRAIHYFEQLLGTEYEGEVLVPLGDLYTYRLENSTVGKQFYRKASDSDDYNARQEAREKLNQISPYELIDPIQVLEEGDMAQAPIARPVEVPEENEDVRDDPQNVHDTGVVNSTKRAIQELIQTTPARIDIRGCVDGIQNAIQKYNGSKIVKEKALRVINTMAGENTDVHGIKERDLIRLVWNKIMDSSGTKKENMLHNMVLQLSEANEWGDVVCPQGRCYHLLACLELNIAPLWAIRREMMNKASIMGEVTNEELKDRFKVEYKGIVSDKFIEDEIDSWML